MQIKTLKGVYQSNTYVIESDGTQIVIEAGAPMGVMRKALGNKAPSAIFLTHEHFDHVAHIADYAAAYPNCPIYCHPATLKEIKTGEINQILGTFAGVNVAKPDSYKNFHTLDNHQVISINRFKVKAIFTPGHSDGSAVYLIDNNLFTGDVLFDNNIGRTDLVPKGYIQMQETLRNLQTLEFEKAYHGHGNPSSFATQQKNIAFHIE